MKSQPELIEGPEAARRFSAAIGKILSVSHEELIRRAEEYQKQAKKNPHRRGTEAEEIKDAQCTRSSARTAES